MLGLTAYEPLPALELTPPSRQVRPALALLLSLLCPGLGHLYIGLFSRAAWIFFSELLCLAFLALQGSLQAAAVLSIPTIYCFAVIDAYFGAREWNAGATSLLEGTNPRIVTVLNLLTKGFGYFYLGDRTKGLLCFFIIAELGNLYVPGIESDGPSTAKRILTGYALDPVNNIVNEFLPDMASHIHVRIIFFQQILNNIAVSGNGPM